MTNPTKTRQPVKYLALIIWGIAAVINGVVFYQTLISLLGASSSIRSVLTAERMISNVLDDMLNAETGQRGYIITSEVIYLAPYYQSLSTLNKSVSDLSNFVSDDGEQDRLVRSLQPLIERKRSEMAQSIAIASESGFEAAKVFIQSHSGLSEMDAIRATLAAMSANEAVRLVHWERQYAERQTWMIASMGGFLVSVLLLLFFLARASRRAQRVSVQLATEHARFSSEISAKAAQLECDRNDMQSINSVAGYLQSSSSIPQVGQIISEFYSQRSEDIYGALYVFSNSRNHLEMICSFGSQDVEKIIDPEQCWGLRQGGASRIQEGRHFSLLRPSRPR